jgi:hypothetical protein
MILGRSTPQWVGLITAVAGFLQVVLPLTIAVDATVLSTILGSATALLGVFIAFLANTSTTPVNDPRLKAGTMVQVTDDEGTVIGHQPVPAPPQG